MITRRISISYNDGFTNGPAPEQALTDDVTIVIPPLGSTHILIYNRYHITLEPNDSAAPNAFMSVVPPSFSAGNRFALTFLQSDLLSEGFAVGDLVFAAIYDSTGSLLPVLVKVLGITGNVAFFEIITLYSFVGLDTQGGLRVFLNLHRRSVSLTAALLRDQDSPPNSPLSGLPFSQAHGDHTQISLFYAVNAAEKYNFRFLDQGQEAFLDAQSANFRAQVEEALSVIAVQFYAYRPSFDPLAQAPIGAYPLVGRLVIMQDSGNDIRDEDIEVRIRLLHPNRIEDEMQFLPPAQLQSTGGAYQVTYAPPSGWTVRRYMLALLGSDIHHARLDIDQSFALVMPSYSLSNTFTAPAISDGRPLHEIQLVGGVLLVQNSTGKRVAVLTNPLRMALPSATGWTLGATFQQKAYKRLDAVRLSLSPPQTVATAPPGVYTLITQIKVGDTFYDVDRQSYLISNAPPINSWESDPQHARIGDFKSYREKLYSQFIKDAAEYTFFNTDLDLPINNAKVLSFYPPIPSRTDPPVLPLTLTPPTDGVFHEIKQAYNPQAIRFMAILPSGEAVYSPEYPLPNTAPEDWGALTVTANTAQILTLVYSRQGGSTSDATICFVRATLYRETIDDYKPLGQAYAYAAWNADNDHAHAEAEGPISATIITPYNPDTRVDIDKTQLPPGRYIVHVRILQGNPHMNIDDQHLLRTILTDISDLYSFTIPRAAPSLPAAPSQCAYRAPAKPYEDWHLLFLSEPPSEWCDGAPFGAGQNGEAWAYSGSIQACALTPCLAWEFIERIPPLWVDIEGIFSGTIAGLKLQSTARHKWRFRGTLERLGDEVTTEKYISTSLEERDIIKAFKRKYKLSLFIQSKCELYHIDLLKLSKFVVVTNRTKYGEDVYDRLVIEEVNIAPSRVELGLRELDWRTESRLL